MAKDIEQEVKNKLLSRGFSKNNVLNNTGLIHATIKETNFQIIKKLKTLVQENERQAWTGFAGWLFGNLDKEIVKRIAEEYLDDKHEKTTKTGQ